MNYLGLDIAKATFDAYLYSSFGQFHATFPNDQAGFEKLKAWLDRHLALSGELVHACMGRRRAIGALTLRRFWWLLG